MAVTHLRWPFAGQMRTFDAGVLAVIAAIERDCDAGMGEILFRLESARFRHNDIRAPILHGLVGGGMPDAEATRLVLTHVDGAPVAAGGMTSHLALACAIMTAYAHGVADALKNSEGVAPDTATAPSMTKDDTAAPGTATAPEPSDAPKTAPAAPAM